VSKKEKEEIEKWEAEKRECELRGRLPPPRPGSDKAAPDPALIGQSIREEIDAYKSEKEIAALGDAQLWWKQNEKKFRRLAQIAKCYLSLQASAVSVERFWSRLGLMYLNRRSRLAAHTAEELSFLDHNFFLL
jgi:hypothetical protein